MVTAEMMDEISELVEGLPYTMDDHLPLSACQDDLDTTTASSEPEPEPELEPDPDPEPGKPRKRKRCKRDSEEASAVRYTLLSP